MIRFLLSMLFFISISAIAEDKICLPDKGFDIVLKKARENIINERKDPKHTFYIAMQLNEDSTKLYAYGRYYSLIPSVCKELGGESAIKKKYPKLCFSCSN